MVLVDQDKLDMLTSKVDKLYDVMLTNKSANSSDVNGFISENDATKYLGRSKTWLWRKRTDGILPYKKLGSKVYYKKDDLFKLIEEA